MKAVALAIVLVFVHGSHGLVLESNKSAPPATTAEIAQAAAGPGGHVLLTDAQAEDFVELVKDSPRNRKRARGSIVSDDEGIILPFDVLAVKDGECRPKMHYAILKEDVVKAANDGLKATGSGIRLLLLGTMADTDYQVVSPRWIHVRENPNTARKTRHPYSSEMAENQVSTAQTFLSIVQYFKTAGADDFYKGKRPLTNPTFYPQGTFQPGYNSIIGFFKELFPEEDLWTNNYNKDDRLNELRREYKRVPDENKAAALSTAISMYLEKGFKPEADCSKTCFAVMGLAKDPPGGFSIDGNTEYEDSDEDDMQPDVEEVVRPDGESGEAGERMRKRLLKAEDKMQNEQDEDVGRLGGMPGQCYNVFHNVDSYGQHDVAAVYHFAGIAARSGNAVVSVEAWADCGANANTKSADSWEMNFYQDRIGEPDEDSNSDFKRGSFANTWYGDFEGGSDGTPTFWRVVKNEDIENKYTGK